MKIVVSGATGTIGRAVVGALCERGDTVVALSRDERRARERLPSAVVAMQWAEPTREPPPRAALAGADAVVHLVGEPIDQRWTVDAKRQIRGSRVLSTHRLVAALVDLDDAERPRTLLAQSATGFYGDSDGRRSTSRYRPATASSPISSPTGSFRRRRRLDRCASYACARASSCRHAAARWPGCCRSSASASAARSRADASTSPGCTSTMSSERCCGAWT